MVTMVGTQNDYVEALIALLELEYDALEAYKAAINRLENEEFKIQLKLFCDDHQKHIDCLNKIIESHDENPPSGSDIKAVLTQGKVVIAGLINDQEILKAMLTNEEDTNTAYGRLTQYVDIPEDDKTFLDEALADEKRHKAWIEQALE